MDFFSEFGDANYLIKLYELFDLLVGKVQIKKSKLEEMNISEDIVRKYSAKETDKMFSQVNTKLLMNELAKEKICYQKRTLKEKIEAQRKHLGYVDVVDESYKGMGVVLSVDTKYAPKLKIYSLKNGTVVDCKIDKRTYNKCIIDEGDIMKIQGQKKKPKMKRLENGQYEPIPGVMELWISNYTKINDI